MMLVRQAYPSDAPSIARIHVETWRATYAGLLPDRVLAGMREQTHQASWNSLLMGERRRECRIVESRLPELEPGQTLLRVDGFGLTANNVTYGMCASVS